MSWRSKYRMDDLITIFNVVVVYELCVCGKNQVFVRPLQKLALKGQRRAIISSRDLEVLFKDIEVILQVNEALLETLRGGLQQFKRLQRDVPLREVGEIFR